MKFHRLAAAALALAFPTAEVGTAPSLVFDRDRLAHETAAGAQARSSFQTTVRRLDGRIWQAAALAATQRLDRDAPGAPTPGEGGDARLRAFAGALGGLGILLFVTSRRRQQL